MAPPSCCTSALLRTIERVPALKVSMKKCTTISAENTWIAKFSIRSAMPTILPITNQYMPAA